MQKADLVLKKHSHEFLGVTLICIAVFFFVSILSFSAGDYHALLNNEPVKNLFGPVGAWIGYLTRSLFGMASYILIPALIIAGTFLFKNESIRNPSEKSLILLLITVSASALVSLIFQDIPEFSGGYAGRHITEFCALLFGKTASYFVILGVNLSGVGLFLTYIFSPDGERNGELTGISGSMRYVMNHLSRLSNSGKSTGLPAVKAGKSPARKFPWITKKKIIIYETEKRRQPLNSLLLPESEKSAGTNGRMLLTEGLDTDYLSVTRRDPISEYAHDSDEDFGIRDGDNESPDGDGAEITENAEFTINDDPSQEDYREAIPDTKDLDLEADGAMEDEDIDVKEESPALSEMHASPSGVVDPTERVFEKIPINEEYIIPTSFLTSSKPLDSESWKNEIRRNSSLLMKMLAEFSIDSEVVNVNRGPVITLYEMQIAPGIKVNRIVSLADDIAMALAAHRVRIVAPIPGKSAIGVEIPNRYRETVTLGDIVKSDEFQTFEGSLVVALGKDILGKPVMLDLKRLPHLLIAGATGSGKSVCVNSIITSLVYNYDPNYVRFIMIDPKMVELQLYNGLPHLLTPVIVDPMMAPVVLKWTLHEMERRYCLLSEMNTRDIERYNEKIERFSGSIEKLPYIIVIIDEMADLIMTSKEVEGHITRIAQKARAVGIHLVVATQRPSVDIITGIIKANFPARIAFQVAQKTDSRTIIDQNGAEKLLGRGDMLYQSPTSSFPIRIQGGFISEEEVERVATHLRKLGKASYIDIEQSLFDEEGSDDQDDASDDLFQEALKIIEETRKASASYLQRRLSIGYNRAARIIEKMEEKGYIGPQIGSKPREVLI
jgi:DNA segregation ATPase FtsK/SpoIIIE-like protein